MISENINLNRTFYPVSEESADSGDFETQIAFGQQKAIDWDNILEHKRVVIIAEAGSGKTHELLYRAKGLHEDGKSAFFMRLEYFKSGFETAFQNLGDDDHADFQEWKQSKKDGYIFLDSVDESKLSNPSDFELALKKLRRELGLALQRVTLIISSRPTFQPKSELQLFNQHLPSPASKSIIAAGIEENNTDEYDLAKSETTITEDNKAIIFSLTPLNTEQIKKYSFEKGVQNTDEFIDAIKRSNIERFATRPRDLDGIISNWILTHSIGSKLDVMKANIKRRIEEDDTNRDQLNPLPNQKVREGIKTIAAICTLTSNSRISVPDKGQLNNAVSIKEVLPNWSLAEQLALLQRPIFDDNAYGTVRFHDRDIREFLAAEWIRELLLTGSRRKIEALFFQTTFGVEVTRPRLREVLAWVALFDDSLRERTLNVNPAILLDGGDPAKFPLEFRKKILKATCQEMAKDDSLRYLFNTGALERFSDKKMVGVVSELFKQYKDYRDIVNLLLRMVWQGNLIACKSETLNIAICASTEKYTRIYALRACSSVCNTDEVSDIIDYFISSELGKNRDIVSELIDCFPLKISPESLISIVNRLLPPEPYSSDALSYSLEQLSKISNLQKLEALFTGFAELALQEPHIEQPLCEVSKQYKWLLQTVSNIAEELVKKRSRIMLSSLGLQTLSQLASFKDSGHSENFENKLRILVPSWEELNCSSFWHDTARVRKFWEQGVTQEWQVSNYGHFWNLSDTSLTQALLWIKEKSANDDKLIALSIAFRIYKENKRLPAERKTIKNICNGNEFLEQALRNYLHPPAMSDELKELKLSQQRSKKRRTTYQAKQRANLNNWREHASKNLEKVSYVDESGKGGMYEVQRVLFNRMKKGEPKNNKWANTNWTYLIEDQNKAVAEAFKIFLITMWKHYTPQLCSEAGKYDNSTPYSVIYGLSGLGVLNAENENWVSEISEDEAKIACRYAIQEINGVPDWLESLYKTHPDVVVEMFYREIQWELFEDQGDKLLHYALDKVSWHCKWMFPELAPLVFKELISKELRFGENLKKCLEVIVASALISNEQLADLAIKKIEGQVTKHQFFWFSILVSVLPAEGISRLTAFLKAYKDKNEATEFAMKFVVNLSGTRRGKVTHSVKENHKTVEHLQNLYLLINQHIHMSEDIDRTGRGCYSPELRDNAQDARSLLFNDLTKIPGKESYMALKKLSSEHPYENARSWMESSARTHLENEADLPDWSVEDVLDFALHQECEPHSPKELFDIANSRLFDLKNELEHAEDSVAGTWIKENRETKLRLLISKWLREHAKNNYSVHQEEEQADGKKPDIRLNSQAFDAPMPIELKIADNCSGNELIERLENQLCNDYLRDYRTNFGVFLLVYRGKKRTSWELPSKTNFDELVMKLQDHAKAYIENRSDIEDIEVIGIDLTKRQIPNRPTEQGEADIHLDQ